MADLEMSNEEAIERILDHMVVHKMAEKRAIKITKALQMAMKALENQPKKGHWKKPDFADDKKWHQCSECGVTTEKLDKNGFKLICNYCPVCGADMRKGEK